MPSHHRTPSTVAGLFRVLVGWLLLIALPSCTSTATERTDEDGEFLDCWEQDLPRVEIGPVVPIADFGVGDLTTADLDGDGDLDAVGSDGFILYNEPTGFVVEPVAGFQGSGARPVDFNGDGLIDVVGLGLDRRRIALIPSAGVDPQAPRYFSIPAALRLWPVDIDEDGFADVIVQREEDEWNTEIWLGNGDSTFHLHQQYAFGAASQLVFARFRTPDELDVLSFIPGYIGLHGRGASGAFYEYYSRSNLGAVLYGAADLELVGKDYIMKASAYPPTETRYAVHVSEAVGDGLRSFGGFEVTARVTALAAADVAGDDRLDVLALQPTSSGGRLEVGCVVRDAQLCNCAEYAMPEAPTDVAAIPTARGTTLLVSSPTSTYHMEASPAQ